MILIRRVLLIAFLCSAIYHVVGSIDPAWLEPNTRERHLVFVGINLLMFGLLLVRHRLFPIALWALTVQQFYSHGVTAIQVYQVERRVDWVSVLVALFLPILAVLATKDLKPRRRH